MTKQPIEKIRDDLFVRKGKLGYSIVYPLKNEDGSMNWKNLKKALFSDLISSIPYLIAVGAILFMLLPGAQQLKEQCEEAILDCQENACDICTQQRIGNNDFGIKFNITNEVIDEN